MDQIAHIDIAQLSKSGQIAHHKNGNIDWTVTGPLIASLAANGMSQRRIAAMFGVSRDCLQRGMKKRGMKTSHQIQVDRGLAEPKSEMFISDIDVADARSRLVRHPNRNIDWDQSRPLVRELMARGLTLRKVGEILGVSSSAIQCGLQVRNYSRSARVREDAKMRAELKLAQDAEYMNIRKCCNCGETFTRHSRFLTRCGRCRSAS